MPPLMLPLLLALLDVGGAAAAVPPEGLALVQVVVFDDAGAARSALIELGSEQGSAPATLRVPAGRWPLKVDGTDMGSLDLSAGAVVDVVVTLGADGTAIAEGLDVNIWGGTATAAETPAPLPLAAAATVNIAVHSLLDGRALAGTQVHLRGAGSLGAVDDEGRLSLQLPIGPVGLAFVVAGHAPRVLELQLSADQVLDVDVVLAPLADELEELTVSAPHIAGGQAQAVSERREQKQLVEVLGAEQMAKSGDSDAAAALRRVTGLSVVGGRYVYVRGLGDRYSSTLVNGAPLPSPEPEKRVVPLDLFPQAVLESIVVQKTWSPELPGEFGGGSVQLRTRNGPEAGKPLLSLGVSTNLVAGTSLVEHRFTPGGSLDFLGFDDGSRAMPAAVKEASDRAPLAEGNALTGGGLSRDELERLGETLPRAWSTKPFFVPPGAALNATVGNTFETPLGEVGALLALTWSQDFLHTDTQRSLTAAGVDDDVVVTDEFDISATERNVALGTILALAWQPSADQLFKAVTLLNRTADDEASLLQGFDDDAGADLRLTRLRFVERQLLVQQLLGDNALPWSPLGGPLQLRWRANYALATRNAPDERSTRYDDVGSADHPRFVLSDRSQANQRLYSGLVDHAADAQVALRTPFEPWGGLQGHVDVGAAFAFKIRAVDTRRFKFLPSGARASDLDLRSQSPEQIFSPENIGSDGFTISEATRNTDNHTGSAVVGAAFGAFELPISNDLSLQGGLRVEGSRLQVTTFELFNAAAPPVVAELQNVDVLPALGLAWTIVDDVTLKASASRTVIRPELRELSPAIYTDVAGGRARFGNPLLQETGILHADVRADWALSPTDGLSLALFGKHFDRPIESVVTAGADQAVTADNVDGALNLGLELEGRLSLRQLLSRLQGHDVDVDLPLISGLWLGGNATLVWSQVQIGPAQQGTLTSAQRGLEGQSPWVGNLQVGSDDDERGFSVRALYNVFGPRIVEVGALGLPDTFEQPFHQLDLLLRQQLPLGLALSLKASNLLDLPAQRTQGQRTVEEFTKGRALSLGLSFTL